jgi:ribosomal protein S18 acetylase RimI-like enzyme
MFHVKPMTPKDFAFAIELTDTMNWNMTPEDFDFNMQLEPNGCFTLFDDQKRIGLATCINYGNLAWFGNLVVKDSSRNRGAGTMLVNHAVSYLKKAGAQTVGLYANLNVIDFYEALDFKRDANFAFFTATPVSFAQSNHCNLKTIEKVETFEIVDFDRRCFGGNREKLLEKLLQNETNLCYVSKEGDKIAGYVTAKVYGNLAEVGPLVCLPEHQQTAQQLFSAVLSKLNGLDVYVSLPVVEKELLKLATQAGFREEFQVARMYLGPIIPQHCIYVAESLERG